MFKEGKIKNYNSEKGYGFIGVEGSHKDIFFHIKDIPNKNIEPQVGETVFFQISEENGKTKAIHINRIDVKVETERFTPQSRATQQKYERRNERRESSRGGSLFSLIGIVIIAVLGYFVYEKYQNYKLTNATEENVQTVIYQHANSKNNETNTNKFSCDGRIHCSEMNSREEARWFVRNCPGTKMDGDGDGDGEPCESDSRW